MLSFQDIFKSDFLDRMTSVSFIDMTVALLISFALGLFIFFIYKHSYAGVMYSASFGVTLIALSMITTILILAVTSNIVLSLGMVGALSIVRFRTAIKEPSDIAFLFWSIAVGIVLAAGLIPLAVFGSIFIGLVLIIFSHRKGHAGPYILVVHCRSGESEKQIEVLIQASSERYSLKSKSVSQDLIELNYELRLRSGDTAFINELAALDDIEYNALVSYNGDYLN